MPLTPEPAPAGFDVDVVTATVGAVVEDVAGTVVNGLPTRVVDVATVVEARAWLSPRNADCGLPQPATRLIVIATVPSPRRPSRERTSQV